MRRIYKYEVRPPDARVRGISLVEMPRGARILSADAQREQLMVWALVDHVQANTELRSIRVLGTGDMVSEQELDGYDFLGTVLVLSGSLVWHVWAKPSDWGMS